MADKRKDFMSTATVTLNQLFERIPASEWESAERRSSPLCAGCVNYDFDFQEFFASPFYYRDLSDENQITVGVFMDGRRQISPRTEFLRR